MSEDVLKGLDSLQREFYSLEDLSSRGRYAMKAALLVLNL